MFQLFIKKEYGADQLTVSSKSRIYDKVYRQSTHVNIKSRIT